MRSEIEDFKKAMVDFKEALENEINQPERDETLIKLLHTNMLDARERLKKLGQIEKPRVNKK